MQPVSTYGVGIPDRLRAIVGAAVVLLTLARAALSGTAVSTPTPLLPCSMDTDCDIGKICLPELGFCGFPPPPTPVPSCASRADCPPPLDCVDDVCTDVATPTATPAPPLPCLLGEDCDGAIEVGSSSGFAGDVVGVAVALHGDDVAYLRADLLYDSSLIDVRTIETSGELRPDCSLDPRMEEAVDLVVELHTEPEVPSASTRLSAYVFHRSQSFPSDPFGEGPVVSCAFVITENAPDDAFAPLTIDRQSSYTSDSQGQRLATGAIDGGVAILGFGANQECSDINGGRCVEGASCNSNFFESCVGFENECHTYRYRCTCFDEIWACRAIDHFGCLRPCGAPV